MLFPLLTLLSYRQDVSRSCLKLPWCVSPRLLFGLLLFLSAGVSLKQSSAAASQMVGYYLLPSRFWQLMSGAILFDLQHHLTAIAPLHTTCSRLIAQALDLAAAVLLALAFALTPSSAGFPMPWSLLAICGALSYIAAGCFPAQRWANGLPVPLFGSIIGSALPVYIVRAVASRTCACSGPPHSCSKTAYRAC